MRPIGVNENGHRRNILFLNSKHSLPYQAKLTKSKGNVNNANWREKSRLYVNEMSKPIEHGTCTLTSIFRSFILPYLCVPESRSRLWHLHWNIAHKLRHRPVRTWHSMKRGESKKMCRNPLCDTNDSRLLFVPFSIGYVAEKLADAYLRHFYCFVSFEWSSQCNRASGH